MTPEECSRRRVLQLAGVLGAAGLAGGAATHALLSSRESFPGNTLQASSFDLRVACKRDDGFTVPAQDSDAFPTRWANSADMHVPLALTPGETRTMTVALRATEPVETALRITGGSDDSAGELRLWRDEDGDTRWEDTDAAIQTNPSPVVLDELPVDLGLGVCGGTPRRIGLEWAVPPDARATEYSLRLEFITRQCQD
ncbi:SipW-dependent-type signal peptide-containing protein [Haloarchaeobius sp. HME9146]|uniref:SipW-dependent-type signal peptide-containing protein n=1 Tax=Haloarchaeobius sp. HME9146 TaxID=2978732 RepID=UPI0021BEF16F|nr:SipW-dependent-type signal peptide-containing protein [Haloarchaeobius sp. HME9146]MCT9097352.1 SipW-dependent-type signal peptide-containing protein [Haloarchaeobius sp. HME9146]